MLATFVVEDELLAKNSAVSAGSAARGGGIDPIISGEGYHAADLLAAAPPDGGILRVVAHHGGEFCKFK